VSVPATAAICEVASVARRSTRASCRLMLCSPKTLRALTTPTSPLASVAAIMPILSILFCLRYWAIASVMCSSLGLV